MTDYTDSQVTDLIVNKLSLAKYQELKSAGTLQADQLYQITDPESAGGSTSWGLINGTLSNQTDLQNALDGTVKLTGNQTVTGTKTFTSTPVISNNVADTSLYFKDTGIASNSTVPSANRLRSFRVMANDNTILGDVRFARQSSGNMTSQLTCRATINDTVYNSAVTANISSTGVAYGTCPISPASSNTTDTYIATTGWCNDPTKSTNVVHRSDKETITGEKTFTSDIKITASTPRIVCKSTTMDITQSGWASGRNSIAWCQDKNDKEAGGVFNRIDSGATSVKTSIYAISEKTGTKKNASLTVGVDGSGNAFTEAPTPATSDNSTKIATTAYVKAQGYIGSANLATCHVVTETYVNGTSWYRVYDDGWVEQGGIIEQLSDDWTIVFLKPFVDGNYNLQGEQWGTDASGNLGINTQTATSASGNHVGNGTMKATWYACGQGA